MKSGGVAGAMNVEGTVGATLTTTATNHASCVISGI
jgi:hypothetical protein